VFSTVLFRSGSRMLFPAESIFGSIEVKSNLSRAELDLGCANVASVKRLNRQRGDSLDILPHLRFPLGPGLTGGGDNRNPYIGIIFGYRGVRQEIVVQDLMERLSNDPNQKQSLPDFVFVREPGYMILRRRADFKPAPPGTDFSEFVSIPTHMETLPLFFLTLNTILGEMRLRRPDFNALWFQTVQECLTS
jgi:hypothetical protein